MRWTSQPSACCTLRTATRPASTSISRSETTPAWRATCVSTTGSPTTWLSFKRSVLLDGVLEEQHAQREEQHVEGYQQAEPVADVGRLDSRHPNSRARRLDRGQDDGHLDRKQQQRQEDLACPGVGGHGAEEGPHPRQTQRAETQRKHQAAD